MQSIKGPSISQRGRNIEDKVLELLKDFWGCGQKSHFQHLIGLSVAIFFVKGTKKDFHFYPAAFHL
jgi:hypothetical protein